MNFRKSHSKQSFIWNIYIQHTDEHQDRITRFQFCVGLSTISIAALSHWLSSTDISQNRYPDLHSKEWKCCVLPNRNERAIWLPATSTKRWDFSAIVQNKNVSLCAPIELSKRVLNLLPPTCHDQHSVFIIFQSAREQKIHLNHRPTCWNCFCPCLSHGSKDHKPHRKQYAPTAFLSCLILLSLLIAFYFLY